MSHVLSAFEAAGPLHWISSSRPQRCGLRLVVESASARAVTDCSARIWRTVTGARPSIKAGRQGRARLALVDFAVVGHEGGFRRRPFPLRSPPLSMYWTRWRPLQRCKPILNPPPRRPQSGTDRPGRGSSVDQAGRTGTPIPIGPAAAAPRRSWRTCRSAREVAEPCRSFRPGSPKTPRECSRPGSKSRRQARSNGAICPKQSPTLATHPRENAAVHSSRARLRSPQASRERAAW